MQTLPIAAVKVVVAKANISVRLAYFATFTCRPFLLFPLSFSATPLLFSDSGQLDWQNLITLVKGEVWIEEG